MFMVTADTDGQYNLLAQQGALPARIVPLPTVLGLSNRLVAPFQVLPGFTPATAPTQSLVGACLVTPVASGIFLVFGSFEVVVPTGNDDFGLETRAFTGPNLTVSGGSVSVGGWTFGTTVPPVVGGTATPQAAFMANWDLTVPSGATATFGIQGVNSVALPLGVPSAIEIRLAESTGGHAVAAVAVQVMVAELPG